MALRRVLAVGIVAVSASTAAACSSSLTDDITPGSEAGVGGARDATGESERDRIGDEDHDVTDALDSSDGPDNAVMSDVADAEAEAAPNDGGADGSTTSDFYVGVSPPDGGATYLTIHAALDAANASSAQARTIHVGPGTYSTGESFPIVLRNGVSLIGSGASTILSGVGPAGIAPPEGLPTTSSMTGISSTDVVSTFVIGDAVKASTIARLTIHGPQPVMVGAEAIVCDRGSTNAPGPTVANTFIDDVTIDGFPIDLNVTSAPVTGRPRTGCAAQVTASTLSNGWYAVVAAGWASPLQLVSVQLGDGTVDGGNSFQNFHDVDGNVGNGAALELLDRVTGARVFGNRISASDMGISVIQGVASDTASGIDIEQNDIGPIDNAGILLDGPTIVSKLVGNTVHDVATPVTGAYFLGCGLILQTNGTPVLPILQLARNNTFFGNDVGVFVRSQEDAPAVSNDFGTAGSAGRNTFRCNASPTQRSSGYGGDVLVELPGATGDVLPFEGNLWDHAPPHVAPAGDDVTTQGNVTVDTANASSPDASACPAGRGPGP